MPGSTSWLGFLAAALVILLIPGPVAPQVFLLGLSYVGLALITDSSYAFLAGSLRPLLGGRVMRGPLPRYASGVIYLGLGVSTALTGRRH